jgi:hypothetical protein
VAYRTRQVSIGADLLGDLWSGHQSLFGGRLLLKARICWAAKKISSGLFEIAYVLVRFDHVALRRKRESRHLVSFEADRFERRNIDPTSKLASNGGV